MGKGFGEKKKKKTTFETGQIETFLTCQKVPEQKNYRKHA